MFDPEDFFEVTFTRTNNYVEIKNAGGTIAKVSAGANLFLVGDFIVIKNTLNENEQGIEIPFTKFDLPNFSPLPTGITTAKAFIPYLILNFFPFAQGLISGASQIVNPDALIDDTTNPGPGNKVRSASFTDSVSAAAAAAEANASSALTQAGQALTTANTNTTAVNFLVAQDQINTPQIASNTSAISSNASQISTTANNLSTVVTDVSNLSSDVAALQLSLGVNTGAISTIQADITTNASGITANASAIAAKPNIDDVTPGTGAVFSSSETISRINSATSGIATNSSQIATITGTTIPNIISTQDADRSSIQANAVAITAKPDINDAAVDGNTTQVFSADKVLELIAGVSIVASGADASYSNLGAFTSTTSNNLNGGSGIEGDVTGDIPTLTYQANVLSYLYFARLRVTATTFDNISGIIFPNGTPQANRDYTGAIISIGGSVIQGVFSEIPVLCSVPSGELIQDTDCDGVPNQVQDDSSLNTFAAPTYNTIKGDITIVNANENGFTSGSYVRKTANVTQTDQTFPFNITNLKAPDGTFNLKFKYRGPFKFQVVLFDGTNSAIQDASPTTATEYTIPVTFSGGDGTHNWQIQFKDSDNSGADITSGVSIVEFADISLIPSS